MRRQLDAERSARRELQRVLAAIRTDSVAAPDLAYLDAMREVPVRGAERKREKRSGFVSGCWWGLSVGLSL